jgi:hypothetical protein
MITCLASEEAASGASTSSEEPRGVNMNKTGFDRYV